MSNDQGFTFEGTGVLERIETTQTKAGKDMTSAIVSCAGKWPQMVAFKLFGRSIDEAKAIVPGSLVRIKGRLGGRDWNGRVFIDATANGIDVLEAAAKQPDLPSVIDEDSVPF